jgi:L-ascorbate metabolism protein UlaG (beta-lactamase superfamily)
VKATLTHVGAATLLIEAGGLRLLTDPALDGVGSHYMAAPIPGYGSTKTTDPSVAADGLGAIDAVLLSHEHHFDNLDDSGRKLLPGAGAVLTTRAGAKKLGANAVGLKPGESRRVDPAGGEGPGQAAFGVTVTATPARHGPGPLALVAGPVIGFHLAWDAPGAGPWWISGDTRWYGGLRSALAARERPAVAIVHVGAARFKPTAGARYTMDAREAAGAVAELGVETAIPIHYEGWSHFKQGRGEVEAEFARAGIADRVRWLELGQPTALEL